MTDKQETSDEVCSISSKFQAISTADPNLNHNEHSTLNNDQSTMVRPKNTNSSGNVAQDRKKNKTMTIDESWMANDLPGVNLPERIIFVVDTAREHDCTLFETRNGHKFSPLSMIKRVIEIFVNVKLGIQDKHEFAIMTLEPEDVRWIGDYTNDRHEVVDYLSQIEERVIEEDQNIYDLGQCFQKIIRNVDLESNNGVRTHVARVILVYARSHCIPQFLTGRPYFDKLVEDSHFFFDSLYVHEPLSDDNDCQDIYAKLSTLDTKGTSFILEAGRNPANIHTNMAKLTAHPLQRAPQDNASYGVFGTTQETQTNV